MTESVRQQLAARGIAPPRTRSAASEPRSAPQATPVPVGLQSSLRSEPVKPAAEVTHYIGPYQLNVANGTHYPGRSRVVVLGPASDELTAALVAAITQLSPKTT